jgi:photosynthetic reaction center cytochrome c subunit
MKHGSNRIIPGVLKTLIVGVLSAALAYSQTAPTEQPLTAEQVFKNIQVLKGTPVNQFMATMGFFSASLGVGCTFCHALESGGSWTKYADDNPRKQTARSMVQMVSAINKAYFGQRRALTCYSCHRGSNRPKLTPDLSEFYSAPALTEAEEIFNQAPGMPSADQILDQYIQALGGVQRLANLMSLVGTGTYQGYEDPEKHAVEFFAKAPGQRTTIVHARDGDITTTYDGRSGWMAAPESAQPVPVVALTGGDLDGVRLEAVLSFPAGVKQTLRDWRVGFPTTIDDREIYVVQGTSAGQSSAKLYFDRESSLLVRLVRYTDSPVGRLPTQIDYEDYREISGIKMPFRWKVTWLDGRSTFELSDVQLNVPIDAAKFARPAPPPSPSR